MFERVNCDRVGRVFGRTKALSGVDLILPAGTITALIGPNAAGKSTLLSVLSTLLSPSSGQIHYGKMPFDQRCSLLRGQIGLVSHSPLVYSDLSALENLTFMAKLYGLTGGSDLAEQRLERAALPKSAWHKPAGVLSRGMTQKLALARAMLHDPSLLLLDEPFTGLDMESTLRVAELLRDTRSLGRIILLVTHDFDMAARVADRTVFMSRGRVGFVAEDEIDAALLTSLYEEHCLTSR